VVGVTFFDAAAGPPPHPAARQALAAAQEDGWADPGKLYAPGRRARQLLDAARGAIAEELGVRPDEVLFCASGTAAVQAGVLGVRLARARTGATVVHSAVEHSAVLYAVADGPAVAVPVDRLGRVDVAAFGAEVARPGVAVAALISASHEVGSVQPVSAVAQACAEAGVPLVVDAAQSVGRVPVQDGWAVLAASAH
jgi:cysteine desulfurase